MRERALRPTRAGGSVVHRARGNYRGAAPRHRGARARMCGIVGVVHRDLEQPVEPGVIRTMCRAIRHRGPDDEGLFVSGQVGLGMRRLSIIDLEGGRQPTTNEDGSKVIVFNGEIYNYREALDAYFQLGYIRAPASPFRDVRKLPPGHWLMWRPSGDLQIHQYWDLPRHAAAAPPEPERHVLEWLDESVAAHLISDVPVAAF